MICPSTICKQQIPDDSIFCDQCGVRLGKCEKCGNIAISKRCGKCGGVIELLSLPEQHESEPNSNVSEPESNVAVNATVIVSSPVSSNLLLIHSEGWSLDVKHGDILGREKGQHSARLAKFPVISGQHGMIEKQGEKWFYRDTGSNGAGSTNKSFINGQELQPNAPYELNDNDELRLANVSFKVKIQ